MTAQWQKVRRDLSAGSLQAGLVVLAIAIGIAGFTAILAGYAILTRELNRGYLATNPASASLLVDEADDRLAQAIIANRDVGAVELRRTLSGRIKGRSGWRNLMLFVVRDYAAIRVGKLQRERGAWPPATGEILIERDAFQVARTGIGDLVTVKTASGSERTLRVSGSVHDVGQAQARMENLVYGYITLDTLALLGEEPKLNALNILVATQRFDKRHIRAVVDEVRKTVEQSGHRVVRVDIPEPGKHPHAAIMGLLLLSMSTFGLFLMALSGITAVNLLTAILSGQVRQIGVMKAIGATRLQIARIYLAEAMLLGVAAVALGLPLGVYGGHVLCRSMAIFLNFDITSFAIPLWVYLLAAAAGILVPLLAAAHPVWRASRIPVLEAIADYGLARTHFGATAFDRALARMGGVSRPLLLAIRNNFRRRGRLALTLLTLTAGGLFFMVALNVRASMIGTLDRLFATKRFDLSVNLSKAAPLADIQRAVRNTPGIARSEGWLAAEVSLPGAKSVAGAVGMHAGAAGDDRFTMVGTPTPTSMLTPDIASGRDLLPRDVDAVLINTALAARGGQMTVGRVIDVRIGSRNARLRIVGVAWEPFSPPMARVPLAFMERINGQRGMANALLVTLQASDPASIERVRGALERNLMAAGIQPTRINSKAESRYGFDQHMLMIYVLLIIVAATLAAVGGLGLMTAMSLSVLERRREMGVLRAIGASPLVIRMMLVAEGTFVAMLSWALAACTAWPVSRLLGDALLEPLLHVRSEVAVDPRGLVIWLALSVALSLVATSIPAQQAARRPIREALGYE